MTDPYRVPQSTPSFQKGSDRLFKLRRMRAKLDETLKPYWTALVAEGEPIAEAMLERALKEAALAGTLFV